MGKKKKEKKKPTMIVTNGGKIIKIKFIVFMVKRIYISKSGAYK
jgi:hypothetical protein